MSRQGFQGKGYIVGSYSNHHMLCFSFLFFLLSMICWTNSRPETKGGESLVGFVQMIEVRGQIFIAFLLLMLLLLAFAKLFRSHENIVMELSTV